MAALMGNLSTGWKEPNMRAACDEVTRDFGGIAVLGNSICDLVNSGRRRDWLLTLLEVGRIAEQTTARSSEETPACHKL